MKLLLLALLITAINFLSSAPVQAAQDIEQKITNIESKVSKKFTNQQKSINAINEIKNIFSSKNKMWLVEINKITQE